jgi:hypothetical protein
MGSELKILISLSKHFPIAGGRREESLALGRAEHPLPAVPCCLYWEAGVPSQCQAFT